MEGARDRVALADIDLVLPVQDASQGLHQGRFFVGHRIGEEMDVAHLDRTGRDADVLGEGTVDLVADRLEVGGVVVNEVPGFRADAMPYGGVKDSGIGREGPRFAIEELTVTRMAVIRPTTRKG